MKKIFIICVLLACCKPEQDIQAERLQVKLVGLTPIYRETTGAGCLVRWFVQAKQIEVISFEPCPCNEFVIGTNFIMLFPR